MCGVIFARLDARVEAAAMRRREEALAPRRMDHERWGTLVLGVFLAGAAFFVAYARIALDGLRILFHEFGHAFAGWVFGRPGIPAFDLMHGGGVAMIWDRQPALLAFVYLLFVAGLVVMRRNRAALAVLVVLGAGHILLAQTKGHEVVFLAMGHGTELFFAGIFLFRGLSGRSILNPLEPPLYVMGGAFLVMRDIGFSWNLVFDAASRVAYRVGKGGIHNDFHRLAEDYLHVSIAAVSAVFLACALATPVLAYLAFRYEARLYLAWDALTDRT